MEPHSCSDEDFVANIHTEALVPISKTINREIRKEIAGRHLI